MSSKITTGRWSRLFRLTKRGILEIDQTPSGEEEELFFELGPSDDWEAIERATDRVDSMDRVAVDSARQDMGERKLFHDRAFYVTLVWILFLILIPILQMILSIWDKGLSNEQFITVITSTTLAVFGFWTLVGKYLFPNDRSN